MHEKERPSVCDTSIDPEEDSLELESAFVFGILVGVVEPSLCVAVQFDAVGNIFQPVSHLFLFLLARLPHGGSAAEGGKRNGKQRLLEKLFSHLV